MRLQVWCNSPEKVSGVQHCHQRAFGTHMKCEVKHNWDMVMEHLSLNGQGVYNLMGRAFIT